MNLQDENKILREILENTLWMAERYSENKMACCASKTIQDSLDKAKELGIVSKSRNEVCFNRVKRKERKFNKSA